jgi:hypothetical protein
MNVFLCVLAYFTLYACLCVLRICLILKSNKSFQGRNAALGASLDRLLVHLSEFLQANTTGSQEQDPCTHRLHLTQVDHLKRLALLTGNGPVL